MPNTKMSSTHFPVYNRLDALNSLVTKCVHVLCFPVNPSFPKAKNLPQSSLYDFNLLTNCNKRESINAPTRFIELLFEKFKKFPNQYDSSISLLDVCSRQSIIDYVIRERILISYNFLIQILQDGGVYNFDLWQLCEINEFTAEETDKIINQMALGSHVFRELSIGGSNWIYNLSVTRGALKKLLCKSNLLTNLNSLKIQQIPFEMDFISILHSCPNLSRLEIAQPSLSNRDILKMSAYLSSNPLPICQSLRYVIFSSSVKEEGIINFLANFPKVTYIRCTPFEQVIDLLDMSSTILSTNKHSLLNAQNVLNNVRALSVAHPMSCDMIDRLLKVCPMIEQLCIEVQDGMNLDNLKNNAPFLSKLELHNSPSMPINFTEHVVPVLESCGKQLKSLSLEYFDHIDLTVCAKLCPNLHSFSAQWFSTVTIQHQRLHRLFKIKSPFSSLQYLRLRPRPHQSLSAAVCSFMLSDAFDLRHIELYCCSELTDQTIYEINLKNSLSHLQTFIMRHGHNVTNDALCRLVSRASSSSNLVFHDCGLVPPVRKEDM